MVVEMIHVGRDFLDWEWGLHFVCVKQTSWGVMTNMVMRSNEEMNKGGAVVVVGVI